MADVNLVAVDPVTGQMKPVTVEDNGDGTLRLVVDLASTSVTLTASELEIGHVVLKNNDTEEHQTVAPDGQAIDANHPNEGALVLTHDDDTPAYRTLKSNAEGILKSATPNRADWKVRQIDTGAAPNTGVAGPAQAVPDGMSVLVQADTGNTGAVKVGSVGESGTVGQFFTLQPGDVLPVTLSVDNFNKIEAQSPSANQIVNLIAEV